MDEKDCIFEELARSLWRTIARSRGELFESTCPPSFIELMKAFGRLEQTGSICLTAELVAQKSDKGIETASGQIQMTPSELKELEQCGLIEDKQQLHPAEAPEGACDCRPLCPGSDAAILAAPLSSRVAFGAKALCVSV